MHRCDACEHEQKVYTIEGKFVNLYYCEPIHLLHKLRFSHSKGIVNISLFSLNIIPQIKGPITYMISVYHH